MSTPIERLEDVEEMDYTVPMLIERGPNEEEIIEKINELVEAVNLLQDANKEKR